MKNKIVAALLIAALAASGAEAMPVSVFLQKADALQAKGMMALFSSDYKALKAEVQRATDALRKERIAAKAAGRPQAYCPPAGKASLNSSELLASFRAIPPAQRERAQVKDALRALLAKKYPCRG
ncbi:MAG: hypothetical protein JOZ90_09750 [Alphaproteobacteria bacterium]|nr:hypothetical protein [Alphaproteobacteria bacterium]MBV9373000.1 hypothetical protein [Alphaproteobacteria bacterium]MBV9901367.1 hypothetical protein [Alphaproteobacteria bacterium]